jgi:hypothetical protein
MHGVAPGLAFAMPSLWRPRRRVRVDWANTFKIDEAFARSRVGVDRSLLAFQSVPTHLYDPDDVLKIRDTAGEAIDAGHHQEVAGAKEIDERAKLLQAFCDRAGADEFATSARRAAL